MINVPILPQPDDTTCGPTSLHAVYQYFGDKISLEQVIDEVTALEDGGTLAVMLANHALRRGYRATIYTYNLTFFDLTWDTSNKDLLVHKLRAQAKAKGGKKLAQATKAYLSFLDLGGRIQYEDLSVDLLRRHFDKQTPILTGLSATYLYQNMRERTNHKNETVSDDVRGTPLGHFVVLCGFDDDGQVVIADPYLDNPMSATQYYTAEPQRLLHSILLGIVTYDANLLVIEPGADSPHA